MYAIVNMFVNRCIIKGGKMKKLSYTVRNIENLKQLLNQSAEMYTEKTAFILKSKNDSRTISYTKFRDDVNALGTALLGLGLKDKCIAVIGENRYEWGVAYLAAACGTGIVVPIDRELPVSEIENILGRCEAEAIIYSDKLSDEIKGLAAAALTVKHFINMDAAEDKDFNLSYSNLIKLGSEKVASGDKSFISAEINSDALAALLFTSGTTGVAKGVMLSHRNICSNIVSVRSTVLVDSTDTNLSILPMHHTYECTIGFLAFVYSGATITFNEGLKHIAKNLKDYRPTILVVVPLILENLHRKIWAQAEKQLFGKTKLKFALVVTTLLNKLFNIDLTKKVYCQIHENVGGRLRLILTGAAGIDPTVSKDFRRMGIKVLQGYGLTECSPLVTGNRDFDFKDSSVGKALPGVEVKIDCPDVAGIGEILVKGPNVMLGYYKDETETSKSIVDGWFHTGDLGKIDRSGYVYITGRSKNIIIVKNGKNVYPEELEACINKNPCVQESLVAGEVDESTGETHIHAHILPNLEYIKEKLRSVNVTKDQLLELFSDVVKNINKDLPLYRKIRKFSIRETEFIKTTTKKIKRFSKDNTK